MHFIESKVLPKSIYIFFFCYNLCIIGAVNNGIALSFLC